MIATNQPTLDEKFNTLTAQWKAETQFESSSTKINAHPAYQDIINMGSSVLPNIFTELKNNGGHWFYALREITGTNPVERISMGNIKNMTRAWLEWAKEHGYRGI